MNYTISINGSGTLKEIRQAIFELGSQIELVEDSKVEPPFPNGFVVWEDETLLTKIEEEQE